MLPFSSDLIIIIFHRAFLHGIGLAPDPDVEDLFEEARAFPLHFDPNSHPEPEPEEHAEECDQAPGDQSESDSNESDEEEPEDAQASAESAPGRRHKAKVLNPVEKVRTS